jgi:hypothetical protein
VRRIRDLRFVSAKPRHRCFANSDFGSAIEFVF